MDDVQIATKFVSMEKDIGHIKEKIDSIENTIENFIESSDKRYAAKYSEWIVKSMVGIIIGTVLIALVNLILKK